MSQENVRSRPLSRIAVSWLAAVRFVFDLDWEYSHLKTVVHEIQTIDCRLLLNILRNRRRLIQVA